MDKKDVIEHWNSSSSEYQKFVNISTDNIIYGPHCPTEKDFNLLGDVKGKKIIELGCGGAQTSIVLAKRGAICTGVDISKEQLKFAKDLVEKNLVKIELVEGDFENLELIHDNCYDIVISGFALNWAKNLDKAFKEAYRVLKVNGIFVFSDQHPFYNVLGENEKELKIDVSYFQKEVIWKASSGINIKSFCPKVSDIINSLIKIGFKIEKILEPEPIEEKNKAAEDWYPIETVKMIPATIIIKSRKA